MHKASKDILFFQILAVVFAEKDSFTKYLLLGLNINGHYTFRYFRRFWKNLSEKEI